MSDADTTVYLFGYTQVLKPDVVWQSDAFTAAFEAADTVIFETEPATAQTQAEVQQTMQRLGFYSEGGTLTAALTETQAEEIGIISQGIGVPLTALNALKPWLASMQLGVVAISAQGYDLNTTPPTLMLQSAREAGKSVDFLEDPTTLMEKLAQLDDSEQVGMLLHSARTLRDDPEQTARVNRAWLQGDVETVGEMLHGPGGAWSSDTLYTLMVVTRNENWRDELTRLMDTQEGTYFVAVGLGHLAGDDSLVTMLQDTGYKVTRQ